MGDPGQRQTLNRFSEPLEDTMFAKPKEMTIYSWGDLLGFHPPARRIVEGRKYSRLRSRRCL